ncbi:hypothetical protein [Gracilibacillus kekensis]|uniref:Uncharacterized protein n=1 Tax=Gracilibacillus kekensis TaxID=1027249 RepID=A0A1M7Q7A4_9BACI|nr:hypothetical protein [Gracilibacillus kekensis]SHN26317.1 hypothetical protein SAMN05216179_2843 [Gracilibacillus kekensis]
MKYYYNPEVVYLLVKESHKKEMLLYNDNPSLWKVPIIGPRPPYFANPNYQPYFPTI